MRLFETQIFSQRDERTESLIRGSRKLIVSVVMLVHTSTFLLNLVQKVLLRVLTNAPVYALNSLNLVSI